VSVGSIHRMNVDIPETKESGLRTSSAWPETEVQYPSSCRTNLIILPLRAQEILSLWSQSDTKRLFDCICVLVAMPLVLPILLVIAMAVRFTSPGPVLFLQERVGCYGRTFTILKFRTMIHDADARYHAVTTGNNQPFTSVGPFLRRWKLDELPQVFNVLLGHMSLVGPRPKMPEHVKVNLSCRPGITGAATIAFAREETILDRIPRHSLDDYYHSVVLPTKRRLDAEYMAQATFFSDLRLIVDSVLRRWDSSVAESLLDYARSEAETTTRGSRFEPISMRQVVSEPVSLRTGTN
jgi:lipopolysaccharide/colanic/teichoic acid biosynthesis glycosyltransferase